MKRQLIFPALALLAAIGTSAIAGLCIDPSTEVSDAVASQASGGAVCSYWTGGYCGATGSNGCSSTYCQVGYPSGSYGSASTETYCGVQSCGSVYVVAGCATTTTVTAPAP
jgi:hypothetical protein